MPLPQQDQKETYTQDEVQHLIAREWAKNEIISLRNGQLELQRQMVEVTGATNAELKSLRETLIEFPGLIANQISQCRRDLRAEIENNFPSKLENMRMEQRIEDKISETDSTLGKQISNLDKKVDSLENKVDKLGAPLPAVWRDASNNDLPITAIGQLVSIAGAMAVQTQAAYAKS